MSAPTPVLRGSTAPQQQQVAIRSDPQRGYVVDIELEGLDFNQMLATANIYIANGIGVNLVSRYGVNRLSVNDATQSNPIDTWELDGDSERLDLFQNPLWGNTITDAQMSAIRAALDADLPSTDSSLSGISAVGLRAYNRYQAGNTEFDNSAYGGGYTLIHNTNVPARWTTNIADFNVGYIYSTAHLITEITNASLWVYVCPPRLVYKINNIPIPTYREYSAWGWRKGRSTEKTAANNRVDITTTYTAANWSVDDYNFY